MSTCIIHQRARRARRGLFWKVIHPNRLCALGGLGGDYFARLVVDTRVVVEVQSLQMGASCPWAPPTWSTEAHPSL